MLEKPSHAAIAVDTLLRVLQDDKSKTLSSLMEALRTSVPYDPEKSPLSVVSACALFNLFITLHGGDLENTDMKTCREKMLERGKLFSRNIKEGRKKLPGIVLPFIRDGISILTHSMSPSVLRAMAHAAESNIQFTVYVTVGAPEERGKEMVEELKKISSRCGKLVTIEIVPDTAIGYIMERVDCVLVGAEGVTQPGGIVSHMGTYTMALAANVAKKPFYVIAESYTFMQIYPLNQADLLDDLQRFIQKHTINSHAMKNMKVDYTPPRYITMLFTDLGIFTPAGVSEKLIELYT